MKFEEYPLSNKDYADGAGAMAYRIGVLPDGLTRATEQIAKLSMDIWREVLSRDPLYVAEKQSQLSDSDQ